MRLICHAQDHFDFSHIADYIYEFGPLTDPYVGLVRDVEHTLHFGLCGRKFVLCFTGLVWSVSAPYVIVGSTQELYTCTHNCITEKNPSHHARVTYLTASSVIRQHPRRSRCSSCVHFLATSEILMSVKPNILDTDRILILKSAIVLPHL